ncbi:hypothetical protein COCON_G00229010 [Conger conger]|uniref:C2H2-type domain-containing protein n=1 Tax=Conger conger TaxID=82655 RepID=A0A9Q1CUP9_CONCO|nr:hypothetical protein COCON_G00229010 [Conger conger]
MHYGKLEEFVTLVTEAVPGLLTCRQRAQLIQGLRMRVNDAEAEVSAANFLELVQTLLKDPAQREHFFQDVFPVQFGLKYDATLQVLVWEFLSRLELLLPVPDLTQTASLLSAAPAGLEECMQCASHQQQLKTLLQHHKCFGQLTTNTLPSIDDCVVPSSWRRMGRARLRTWKEAVVTGNKKTGNNRVIALKWLPESQGNVNVNRPRNFSTRNGNTGWTLEANAHVFACSKCLVFHSDEGYLHQHMKTAHPEEYKEFLAATPASPFPCSSVSAAQAQSKSFLSQSELSKHQRCHTEERPYLCTQCGKGFKWEGALNRHTLIHTGERPYSCSQCGKTFLSSGELLKHQRFHTGERPFNCSLCGKTFMQYRYLKRRKRSHTGERPYSCPLCRKTFSCSTHLKRHARVHAEEKPFQCSKCGKGFSHSYLMKTHQQTHAVKEC